MGLGLAINRWGVDVNNGRVPPPSLPRRDASTPDTCHVSLCRPALQFSPTLYSTDAPLSACRGEKQMNSTDSVQRLEFLTYAAALLVALCLTDHS